MTKKVRTYSDEFKSEAVKKITDNNGNISATAPYCNAMALMLPVIPVRMSFSISSQTYKILRPPKGRM